MSNRLSFLPLTFVDVAGVAELFLTVSIRLVLSEYSGVDIPITERVFAEAFLGAHIPLTLICLSVFSQHHTNAMFLARPYLSLVVATAILKGLHIERTLHRLLLG